MNIERMALPGIGVSYAFTTTHGQRLGVISYLDGRRDLVLYDPEDPERVAVSTVLTANEVPRVAELLSAAVTVDHVADVEGRPTGVAVARIPIRVGSPYDGQPIRELRTVADVVAVIRSGRVVAGPDPDFVIRHGDTVVAAGRHPAVAALGQVLTRDPDTT